MMRMNCLRMSLLLIIVIVSLFTFTLWTKCSGNYQFRPSHSSDDTFDDNNYVNALTSDLIREKFQNLDSDRGNDLDFIYNRKNLNKQRHDNLVLLNDNKDGDSQLKNNQDFEEILCQINDEYMVSCRQQANEIYVPFSFLHRYFEVFGKVVTNNEYFNYNNLEAPASLIKNAHPNRYFEWSHSYGKIYHPKQKYSPLNQFMHFENYNVETRDRVKCICAINGVPVSTQWNELGYYYPTQIAQFGLSHYSKNLTIDKKQEVILDDSDNHLADWIVPNTSRLSRDYCAETIDMNRYEQIKDKLKLLPFDKCLTFATSNNNISRSGAEWMIQLDLTSFNLTDLFNLNVNYNFNVNSSLIVVVEIMLPTTIVKNNDRQLFFINYVISESRLIAIKDDNKIIYGLGEEINKWRQLTRDLVVDLQKGVVLISQAAAASLDNSQTPSLSNLKFKINKNNLRLVKILLTGNGIIDNLILTNQAHERQFYAAAEWFVKNQNKTSGGWANPVKRRVARGFNDLEPGWYSAMGQGHALSVLSRAYYHSHDERFLYAALKALRPFRVPSWQKGVLAMFLGKYPWYEEYPTTPASFVLNGFIYSLLGLYDLKMIANLIANNTKNNHKLDTLNAAIKEASSLYDEGMHTLCTMLPLYDTGSGTTYDLRHVTLVHIAHAPNIARWDYHATHVNQLFILSTILDSHQQLIVNRTADRWLSYMHGKRAPHN